MRTFDATLAPAFKGYDPDLTEENIQARIRGNLLMALSNKFGHLVITSYSIHYTKLYEIRAAAMAA